MIWIVSGPSSCGKSTFIKSPKASHITGLNHGQKVVFPFSKELRLLKSDENSFFHYNILRPLWKVLKKRPAVYVSFLYPHPILLRLLRANRFKWDLLYKEWDYRLDPQWMELLTVATPKKAIVLVADNQTLIERALGRKQREKNLDSCGSPERDYPAMRWVFVYNNLNLPLIYEMWCKELRRAGVEFIVLDAETFEQLHGHSLVQAQGNR